MVTNEIWVNRMEELIEITVIRDDKTKMIKGASQDLNKALSSVIPPLDMDKDILRLKRFTHESDRITLIYEISRDARRSKKDQYRSPYREKGMIMHVSMNSMESK